MFHSAQITFHTFFLNSFHSTVVLWSRSIHLHQTGMTYQRVDLSSSFTAGGCAFDKSNPDHSTQELRHKVHGKLRDIKMTGDHRRETDRWVKVCSRDAEEGPCGDNEANTECECISETATVFIISQSSRQCIKGARVLDFARLFFCSMSI